jgi:hypothetical protein
MKKKKDEEEEEEEEKMKKNNPNFMLRLHAFQTTYLGIVTAVNVQ